MSWLYTIVFAGLMFSSSEGNSASTAKAHVKTVPAVVEEVIFDETEQFTQTYPLTANGRVNISNVNGSITVEAWNRNEVKLEYTKVADSKERLSDVEVKIVSRPDYFGVETDYGNWKNKDSGDRWKNGGKLNVEFRLMLPRGAVLNEVETVNGSVTVSDFINITKISAVNGSVNASNIRGTAKLSTVNGEVKADFDRLEAGSKISLDTVNGRVNLVLPSDANATVRADSLNGNITNDFGLPVRKGKYVGRDLYGKLGNGEVQIRLNSVNGGLTISRKDDGKGLSPATNLLPQKENHDDAWQDGMAMLETAKLNNEIAKAVKEGEKLSTKLAAKAMADAQTELSKIQMELPSIATDSVALIKQTEQIMNSEEMKQNMREAQLIQRDVLARLSDAAFFPSVPWVEKKSESFKVKGTPKVTVNAKDCSVSVRGWDKSEVQYRVTRFADSRTVTPLKINENHSDSTVNINIENPDLQGRRGIFSNGPNKVRIEIFVPHTSNLKISSNGEIRLDGVSGDVELVGSEETINVRDVDGNLRVINSDGRIRVIGFRGDIVAETSNGAINLEGDFKSVKASATEGPITLSLPENTSADLEANCDDVQGEGITVSHLSGDATASKYRIGNGGARFQVKTGGKIRVRGTSVLSESF